MRLRDLWIVVFVVCLAIDALPKKNDGKKKMKMINDNDSDDDSSGDNSSGEKPKTLEKIGFQQEAAVANTNQHQATAQQQQVVATTQQQANQTTNHLQQQHVNNNTNSSSYNQGLSAPQQLQQQYQATNTTQYSNQAAASTVPQQQSTTNATTNATQQFVVSSNSNVTTNDNTTGSNNQHNLFQSLLAVKGNLTDGAANATEDPVNVKRKAELKCFSNFGESIKGGMGAPELVKVYEDLHECLQGKCNYKKAEITLQTALSEKTFPGQEVFHRYKCFYNWYELIKKACKPSRKVGEEESETGEEVGSRITK